MTELESFFSQTTGLPYLLFSAKGKLQAPPRTIQPIPTPAATQQRDNRKMATRSKLSFVALILAGLSFLVFTFWIIHEANIGRDNIFFKTVRATPYGDKIGHVMLAGALTLVLNFFFGNRAFRPFGLIIPWGSLAVVVLAALEEASQHFLPTRSLDIADALANVLGILLFSIPAIVLRYRSDRQS